MSKFQQVTGETVVPMMAAKNSGEAGVVQERLDSPAWDRLGPLLWWAVQVERHLGSGQTPEYEIGRLRHRWGATGVHGD